MYPLRPFRILAIASLLGATALAIAWAFAPHSMRSKTTSRPTFAAVDLRDAELRWAYLNYAEKSKRMWGKPLTYNCSDWSWNETYRAAIYMDPFIIAVEVNVEASLGASIDHSMSFDESFAAARGEPTSTVAVARRLEASQVDEIRGKVLGLAQQGVPAYGGQGAMPNTAYILEACVDGQYAYYERENPDENDNAVPAVIGAILATSGESIKAACEREPAICERS